MTDTEIRKKYIADARRCYEDACTRALDQYERDVEFWMHAKLNRDEAGEYLSAGWYTRRSFKRA